MASAQCPVSTGQCSMWHVQTETVSRELRSRTIRGTLVDKPRMMKLILALLAGCALSAHAFVSVPSASRAMRTGAASSVVMEHVHRAQVVVGDNEPVEAAVKRFRREVSRSGHLPLLRARKRFRSPAEIRQDILKKEARRLRFIVPSQR